MGATADSRSLEGPRRRAGPSPPTRSPGDNGRIAAPGIPAGETRDEQGITTSASGPGADRAPGLARIPRAGAGIGPGPTARRGRRRHVPQSAEARRCGPWLAYHGGWYYLATTSRSDVRLRRSRRLHDLEAAPDRVVWADDDPSRNRDLWAPEFHRIDAGDGPRWYLFYTACGGREPDHRMYVARSAGDDPMGPYAFRAKLRTDPDDRFYAIDGTVLTMPGRRGISSGAAGPARWARAFTSRGWPTPGPWPVPGWLCPPRASAAASSAKDPSRCDTATAAGCSSSIRPAPPIPPITSSGCSRSIRPPIRWTRPRGGSIPTRSSGGTIGPRSTDRATTRSSAPRTAARTGSPTMPSPV